MDGMEKNVLHVTNVCTNEANNKKATVDDDDDDERKKSPFYYYRNQVCACLNTACTPI